MLSITPQVQRILNNYAHENAGVKSKIYSLLMSGRLAGTGKMVILPVDQGVEHGPDKSFAPNIDSYDPDYHCNLAINAGLSAYATNIGFLEHSADKFAGQIPMILKLNSANTCVKSDVEPDQAITASVKDALRLGCHGVGFTIYPGSGNALGMFEEAKEVIKEAKSYGLLVMLWSYPRGGNLSTDGQTAIDICAYAGHIAASLGAHIIKLKPPTHHIEDKGVQKMYDSLHIPTSTLSERVAHIMKSCFNGKRIVLFSGGAFKDQNMILDEIREIHKGHGYGSIIGRNAFQRPYDESISLLKSACKVYSS